MYNFVLKIIRMILIIVRVNFMFIIWCLYVIKLSFNFSFWVKDRVFFLSILFFFVFIDFVYFFWKFFVFKGVFCGFDIFFMVEIVE